MDPDGRVDVLRYPEGAEPRVRAVRAGTGPERVREAEHDHLTERRKDRFPLWVGVPLVVGGMSLGLADGGGLPWWTPVVAAVAALSLLWWLFTVADARRPDPTPELLATDCPVAVARGSFDATVVDEPAPPDDGTRTTWTGESAVPERATEDAVE